MQASSLASRIKRCVMVRDWAWWQLPLLMRLYVALPPVSALAVIGIAAAFWLARLSANLLYGVSPSDLVSYCAAAGIVVGAAVFASYLPARRAALLDPSRALRYE